MTQAVCAQWAENKLNNLNLSNSLLQKGTLVCSFISASHRHKPPSLLTETFLVPAPLPSCLFLPWTRPFFLLVLLAEWAQGYLFNDSILGTLLVLTCWCSKKPKLLHKKGLVCGQSARQLHELQLQGRTRLLPTWSSLPGLWNSTIVFTKKGSASSRRRSDRKIPVSGFIPFPQSSATPLF